MVGASHVRLPNLLIAAEIKRNLAVFTLRPYQEKILEDIRAAYRSGFKRPLLVSPTASGKSSILGYMLLKTTKRVLILAHRRELCEQIAATMPVPYGMIVPGYKPNAERIQVGTMQTVSKRLDKIPDFDWIISDESHLSVCETWSKIIRRFENSWHLGMSASPTRTDGTGLGVHFDCLVNGPGIGELIKLGFLCNIRTYAPAADVGFIRSSYGEYLMSDASSKYDKPHITGDVISHYKKLADNKKALVFCCSVEHADHVAKEFRIAGYSAINVDGSMDKTTRAERIRDFRIGKIQVLTNCDLLTTGFDCSDIEVGIMLRPTQSLSLYIQMVGRIYRVHYGKKEAILIDAVGNVTRHGMPNEDRKWTLADTEKKSKGTTTPQMSVKICPKCFAAQESGLSSCTFCGFVFEVQARVIEQVDGELEEIKSVNKRQEQGSAKNYEQLVILGRQRGMKHPEGWARHVMAARGKKYG